MPEIHKACKCQESHAAKEHPEVIRISDNGIMKSIHTEKTCDELQWQKHKRQDRESLHYFILFCGEEGVICLAQFNERVMQMLKHHFDSIVLTLHGADVKRKFCTKEARAHRLKREKHLFVRDK